MNIIERISKENKAATIDIIVEEIRNIKDGYEGDKLEKLEEILEYACGVGYLVAELKKKRKKSSTTTSYKLNSKVGSKTCYICDESLTPFPVDDYNVGKNFVDRSTFESLAKELVDFKIQVREKFDNIGVSSNSELMEVKEENTRLKNELSQKELFVNFLLEKICRRSIIQRFRFSALLSLPFHNCFCSLSK